jgi:uncharacterized protein YbjT (DUF2867 family)
VACELLVRAGHESKSYDLTGPEALTLPEIADRIAEAIGKPVRFVEITPPERRQALLSAGVSPYSTVAFSPSRTTFQFALLPSTPFSSLRLSCETVTTVRPPLSSSW